VRLSTRPEVLDVARSGLNRTIDRSERPQRETKRTRQLQTNAKVVRAVNFPRDT
jgi:hypothetical protein